MTDTSTRQRLLGLWEKCPECRPKGLDWRRVDSLVTIAHWELGAHFISMKDAFARDAMEEYLLGPVGCDGVSHYLETIHEPRGYLVHSATVSGKNFQPTRTDALISAVEAVMDADKEKQDGTTS